MAELRLEVFLASDANQICRRQTQAVTSAVPVSSLEFAGSPRTTRPRCPIESSLHRQHHHHHHHHHHDGPSGFVSWVRVWSRGIYKRHHCQGMFNHLTCYNQQVSNSRR